MGNKPTGTPPWKNRDSKVEPRPKEPVGPRSARHPQPVDLSADELLARQRNIRRWGWAFVAICFVVAVAAALVMLTMNRGTADLGLRGW